MKYFGSVIFALSTPSNQTPICFCGIIVKIFTRDRIAVPESFIPKNQSIGTTAQIAYNLWQIDYSVRTMTK